MNRYKRINWFFTYLGLFFLVVIFGTLVHEFGHYIVAVIYGVPARIAYAYTFYFGTLTTDQRFWFIMGGIISSWVVSIIGITIILFKYRNMHSQKEQPVGIGQTISIMAVSFSFRFIFNAGLYFIETTLLGNWTGMDEAQIAVYYLGIAPEILVYGSAVIALTFIIITLYYIPRFQRYIILIGGITGGILGYFFWYYWVGPIVLPVP